MKPANLELKVGLVVTVALLILGYFIARAQDLQLGSKGYSLICYFSDVQGLKKQATVYLSGVKVGEVKALRFSSEQNKVLVRLWIQKGIKVRSDSTAKIAVGGVFGDKSIWIEQGGAAAPFALAGSEIKTVKTFDLGEALASVGKAVDSIQQFADSGKELMTFLKGETGKISDRVVGILDENRENIKKTLQSFADLGPDVKTTLNKGSNLFDGLMEIVDQVRKGEGTVGKLIKDDAMYKEVKRTIKMIGDAAEGLQDKTALGSLVSMLMSSSK